MTVVLKAARKPPKGEGGEEWRGIHRAADGTAPQVSVTFIKASKTLAKGVDAELVADLIRRGVLDRLDTMIPWRTFQEILRAGVGEAYIRAITKAADAASTQTGRAIREAMGISPVLTFDAENPRVMSWINRKSAALVREVSGETRNAIKVAVARTQLEELSPLETWKSIRDVVGLTTKQAIAAQNIFHRGVEEGLDRDEAMREASAYAQRTLNYRANVIARTETIRAANQGQIEGWNQAADEGLFKREDAEVEWIVTPDDRLCPICEPMDGVTRPIDGEWSVQTNDGVVAITNPSEVHPQCRCAMKLVIP